MPYKSSSGRNNGKLLSIFQNRTTVLGQGIGGGAGAPSAISASGGDIANGLAPGNGYKYHTFSTPGTFTVSSGSALNFHLFLVGGGGAGNPGASAGGGGGIALVPNIILPVGSYTVTVGPGGAGFPNPGARGGDSSITNGSTITITAAGGGGGGSAPTYPGGSGSGPGGTATQPTYPQTGIPAGGVEGYGNPGSSTSGAGGGAGGTPPPGGGPYGTNGSEKGGDGMKAPSFTGPLIGLPSIDPYGGYWAGGGGGGVPSGSYPPPGQTPTTPAPGGAGGGGAGGVRPHPFGGPNYVSTAGANYLGGGGGAGGPANGSAGGSGIVVIRYIAAAPA